MEEDLVDSVLMALLDCRGRSVQRPEPDRLVRSSSRHVRDAGIAHRNRRLRVERHRMALGQMPHETPPK